MMQQEFSMKLHIKTVVLGALIPFLALTFLTSCSNLGLFSSIEKEVKLNDPTMRGIITSLEVVNGNIFVTNGTLYQRSGGTGDWNKMSLPSGAERCSEVASDGTYLYARFTTSDIGILHSVERYDPASGGWSSLTGVDNVARISSGNNRIYAFTGINNLYKAYVTTGVGSTVINSTPIASDITTPTGTARDSTGTTRDYISTNKKVYSYDGTTFAELGGVDASPVGVTGITTNGTNVYVVNTGFVWRFNTAAPTTGWTSIKHSMATTTNIVYLGAGGKNLLLIGSSSLTTGLGEVVLAAADGSFPSTIGSPGDTATSAITTDAALQYKNSIGLWAVYRIFAVTTAVPSGNSYVLYASIAESTYGGLWSYYSGTRNEWNRE